MKKIIPYIVGGVIGAGLAVSMGAVTTAANPKCVQYIETGPRLGSFVFDDGSLWESEATDLGRHKKWREIIPANPFKR